MSEHKFHKITRGKAIRKYCLDCSGGRSHEVTHCPFSECPLYGFRRSGKGSRTKAIKQYCFEHCMNQNMNEVRHCLATTCFFWGYRHCNVGKGVNMTNLKENQAVPCKEAVFEAENEKIKGSAKYPDASASYGGNIRAAEKAV